MKIYLTNSQIKRAENPVLTFWSCAQIADTYSTTCHVLIIVLFSILNKNNNEEIIRFEQFVEKFVNYLNEFGYRGNKEIDIFVSRQIEDCSFILNIITSKKPENENENELKETTPIDNNNNNNSKENEEKLCSEIIDEIYQISNIYFLPKYVIRRLVKVFRNCFRLRESPKHILMKIFHFVRRIFIQICGFIYYRLYNSNINNNNLNSNEFMKIIENNSLILKNIDIFSFNSNSSDKFKKMTDFKEIIDNCNSISNDFWEKYDKEESNIQNSIFYLYLPEIEFIINNFYELTNEQIENFKETIELRKIEFEKNMKSGYDYRVFDLKTQEIPGFFFKLNFNFINYSFFF